MTPTQTSTALRARSRGSSSGTNALDAATGRRAAGVRHPHAKPEATSGTCFFEDEHSRINMGDISRELGRPGTASFYWREAMPLLLDAGDKTNAAAAKGRLGSQSGAESETNSSAREFQFKCPSCACGVITLREHAGKKTRCQKCGTAALIPAPLPWG